VQYDLSLRRRLPLGRGAQLDLEVNAFNLFNRANFAAPIDVLSDARFGQIVRTKPGSNPRQMQIGAKVTF
jgi:hypothetical protein